MDRECCEILHRLITEAHFKEFNLAMTEEARELWLLAASLIWLRDNDDGKRVFARKVSCIKHLAKSCVIMTPQEAVPMSECGLEVDMSVTFNMEATCNMEIYVEQ